MRKLCLFLLNLVTVLACVVAVAQPLPLDLIQGGEVAEERAYISAWREATPQEVQGFLETVADVNAVNKEGDTLLHYALRADAEPRVIRLLLEAGADPRARNDAGDFPLLMSAKSSLPEVSVLLLTTSAKEDINSQQAVTGATPLINAIVSGAPQLVQTLLNAGADASVIDSLGADALGYAVSAGNVEIVSMILSAGGNLNQQSIAGVTPLMLAVRQPTLVKRQPDYELIRFLLDAGADTTLKDKNGMTAYDYAVANPYFDNENLLARLK